MRDRLYLRETMVKPWLIQRLRKPNNIINPFSFGGGLENGGLNKDAANILKRIFTFDYMGSSEFEWGAVPAALQFLAEQASATKRKWLFWKVNAGLVISGCHKKVFYICPKSYEEGVKTIIDTLLLDESTYRLKEYCGLSGCLTNPDSYKGLVGWLELDNGFFFFIDEEMFNNVKRLFGIA